MPAMEVVGNLFRAGQNVPAAEWSRPPA
ncbi:MAG: hypothetical protein ACLVJK_05240 [Alistipes putredinis]